MPVLHRALILPQCILNVPYFVKDVKGGDFPALPPAKSKALGTGDPLIVRDLFQGLDRTTDGRITSFRCTGIILCPQVKKVNCLLC